MNEAELTIAEDDIRKFGYLLNSGILRIKEQSSYKALDQYDKDTMTLGQRIMKDLCTEYRRLFKDETKAREPYERREKAPKSNSATVA